MIWKNYNIFVPSRLVCFAPERPESSEHLPTPKPAVQKPPSYPLDQAKTEFKASKAPKPVPFLKRDHPDAPRAERIAATIVQKIAPNPETQDIFLKQLDTDLNPDTEIRPLTLRVLEIVEQRLTFEQTPVGPGNLSLSARAAVELGDETEIAADVSLTAYPDKGTDLKEDHLLGLALTRKLDTKLVTALGLRSEFQVVDNKINITGVYGTADFGEEPTSVGIGAAPSDTQDFGTISLYVNRGGFVGSFNVDPKTRQFQGELAYAIKF